MCLFFCAAAGEGPVWPEKAKSAAEHLRNVFHRMGLSDKDIVALSGAHTLGRAKPDRSGFGKDVRLSESAEPAACAASAEFPVSGVRNHCHLTAAAGGG